MPVSCSVRLNFFEKVDSATPCAVARWRLFLRREQAQILRPIPGVARNPDACVHGHGDLGLAEDVLAKGKAHGSGNQPEQGKALQPGKQADHQKKSQVLNSGWLARNRPCKECRFPGLSSWPRCRRAGSSAAVFSNMAAKTNGTRRTMALACCRVLCAKIEHDRPARQGSQQDARQHPRRPAKRKQRNQSKQNVRDNKEQGGFRKAPKEPQPQHPGMKDGFRRLRFADESPVHSAPGPHAEIDHRGDCADDECDRLPAPRRMQGGIFSSWWILKNR